jgi:hypothetical protein
MVGRKRVEQSHGSDYPDNDLLQCVQELSSLCEQIEQAVDALVQRHGDRSETVDSARALQVSVAALKRELLQHYLEYRMVDAARRSSQEPKTPRDER